MVIPLLPSVFNHKIQGVATATPHISYRSNDFSIVVAVSYRPSCRSLELFLQTPICLFPTPFLHNSEKTMNCAEMGLGIFRKNRFIGIGCGFFSLYFFGFPAFSKENHGKHGLLIINNRCNYRGDLWNFMSFLWSTA